MRRSQVAHHRRMLAMRAALAGRVDTAWDRFAGLDNTAANRFTATVAPLVDGAVHQVDLLAQAYLTVLDRVEGFNPPDPPGPVVIRGGVPTAEVYRRSIVQARVAISNGRTFEDAMNAGRSRARATAETDVVLANRQAIANGTTARPWITGYRRVLTGRSCVLCATASTQRYKRANLLPIHTHCDCDVAPIYGRDDPAVAENKARLAQLESRGGEYWKDQGFVDSAGNPVSPGRIPDSKVEVYDHGELGPTLTDSAHAHTEL